MTATADLDHAIIVLELQEQLIDSLQREIGVLRAERDDARNLRAMFRELLDAVGAKLKFTRICIHCQIPFQTPREYGTVCPACRSIVASRSAKSPRRLAAV